MSNTVNDILREEKINWVQSFVDIDIMLYKKIMPDTLNIIKVQGCKIDEQNKVTKDNE